MAILLVKCDFSYSRAAADKISTDLRARAVSLRQLSYLLHFDRRREMCIGHTRARVCLSVVAFPHYCTDPDVTCGNGRGAH